MYANKHGLLLSMGEEGTVAFRTFRKGGMALLFSKLRGALGRFWQSVGRFVKRKDPSTVFIALMATGCLTYILIYAIMGNAQYTDLFFLRTKDLFMDFYNSVRDAAQGEAAYTVHHVIYPPMANLLYLICSRFIPTSYNNSEWFNRYTWPKYSSAILFYLLFTLVLVLFFFALVHEKKTGSRGVRFGFALFAVFNAPFLYMIERGNMLLLCLIALFVYAFTYNSEKAWWREIGLLCLAFSFCLKLYPVVFGWFLIADKRYREAVRCFIYGMLMLILPSFLFGGPAIFVQILRNITSFSEGGGGTLTVIAAYGHLPLWLVSIVSYAWVAVCAVCFAISPWLYKDKPWKTWMIGLATIMAIPSLTSLYGWAFFLIPLIMLLRHERLSGKNWFYVLIMTVPFIPLPFRVNWYLSTNSFLVYPMTAVLTIVAVTDTVITLYRLRKGRKEGQTEREAVTEQP